jgi:hypothetical protein
MVNPVQEQHRKRKRDYRYKRVGKYYNILRLYLSAHTPAKKDIKNVGSIPHIIESVIIEPLCVFNVMYQVIAYCTSIEPNSDIVCPDKNRAVVFFQFVFINPS